MDIEKVESTVEISDTPSEDGSRRPLCFLTTWQELICVWCCTLAVSASPITTGFCMLSLSKVSEDFGVIGGGLTWATGAVGLGSGSFYLIMGGVSDALGRKNMIIVSFTIFAIMQLICGFLKNFIGLCIVRAIIGAVIAGATPSLAGILGSSYVAGKRKNMVFALFSAGAPVGMVGGLLIGGILSQVLSWRAGHWFLAIVYACMAPVVWWVVPLDPKLNRSEVFSILKQLDYLGGLISLSGFTLFCFALTQVDSTPRGWKTPYILATFIVGFCLIVSLGFYENYIPKKPLMPMQIWSKLKFCITMIIISLCWIDFQGCLTFYSILYFEEIKNYSPLLTLLCILPMGVGGILVNVFAAFTLHLIPGTVLLFISTACFTLLLIVWQTMTIDRNYWLGPFWGYLLAVIGADLAYNVANMVTLTSVDVSLQSSLLGIFNTVTQLSGTVGLGITSLAISARYELYGTDLETRYPDRLFDSFKNAYWVAIGCGALAFCLCPFVRIGVVGNKKK